MNVRVVPLLAALVPFFAVHATYLVAASYDLVDWCIPYIDSCTSISATGRKPPASYLFRATMLPSAVFMAAYWWFSHAWLRAERRTAKLPHSRAGTWMLSLGLLACVGLVMYVTVLGEAGDLWARQRRAGTVLFFSFTFLSQLLLVHQLRQLREQLPTVQGPTHGMWFLCILLLSLGILTVLIDAWDSDYYETIEDAFEWVLTLLLQTNFLLGYGVWRRARWGMEISRPGAVPGSPSAPL